MTDRQRRSLEILADPTNRVAALTEADRNAVDAALIEIDRLTREYKSLNAEVGDYLTACNELRRMLEAAERHD